MAVLISGVISTSVFELLECPLSDLKEIFIQTEEIQKEKAQQIKEINDSRKG